MEPDALGQASADAGDGQADVVTAAGTGARRRGPEQDDGVDDVFEIADAKDVGERGS